jgi:hypothetical protein
MFHLAQTATQSIAYLTERVGLGKLGEERGHEPLPAGESLGMAFSAVFFDERRELGARDV